MGDIGGPDPHHHPVRLQHQTHTGGEHGVGIPVCGGRRGVCVCVCVCVCVWVWGVSSVLRGGGGGGGAGGGGGGGVCVCVW